MQKTVAFAVLAMMSVSMFGRGAGRAGFRRHHRDFLAGHHDADAATDPVYPRYPRRPYTTLYPLPYGIDYPGPNAVRQCVSRLVPEYRPSGTVIVPRMRCWWAFR